MSGTRFQMSGDGKSQSARLFVGLPLLIVGVYLLIAASQTWWPVQLPDPRVPYDVVRRGFWPDYAVLLAIPCILVGAIALLIHPGAKLHPHQRPIMQRLGLYALLTTVALMCVLTIGYAWFANISAPDDLAVTLAVVVLRNIPTIILGSFGVSIALVTARGYRRGGTYQDYKAAADGHHNFFWEVLKRIGDHEQPLRLADRHKTPGNPEGTNK